MRGRESVRIVIETGSVRRIGLGSTAGPEDDPDPCVNGDVDSLNGEEDEAGFDDMPVECGWEDEGEEEDDEDEDE